jgi:8-oxo-dGTP diphosphatase
VKVAVGICQHEGRILLGRRMDDDGFYGGYWEFPGGKVDPGESAEEALVREFSEELGVRVESYRFYRQVVWTYPHRQVDLHFFQVSLAHHDLTLFLRNAHQELGWFSVDEALALQVLPANIDILKSLRV